MITYLEGDIFSSPAQVLVNTVNTIGVMGKGIALAFKERYPDMFNAYKVVCEKRKFKVGQLLLYRAIDHMILLFPTKENWRNPSKIEYIEKGLINFREKYIEKGISSIAFPKLGCGNGELNWDDVKPVMEKYLGDLPIDVYIYLGTNKNVVPEHRNQADMQNWFHENAKDMSFNGLIDEIKTRALLVPYECQIEGKKTAIKCTLNNSIIIGDEEISEEQLFKIWDDIRTQKVFLDNTNYRKVYELLFSLGYLTKIKVLDGTSNMLRNGYQLNEGLDRANVAIGA